MDVYKLTIYEEIKKQSCLSTENSPPSPFSSSGFSNLLSRGGRLSGLLSIIFPSPWSCWSGLLPTRLIPKTIKKKKKKDELWCSLTKMQATKQGLWSENYPSGGIGPWYPTSVSCQKPHDLGWGVSAAQADPKEADSWRLPADLTSHNWAERSKQHISKPTTTPRDIRRGYLGTICETWSPGVFVQKRW